MNAAVREWTDVAGRTRATRNQPDRWESWALHVEEITGHSTRAWLDDGYDAWENGEAAEDFATAWLISEARAGGNADTRTPPFQQPDDPSSPLLSTLALLAVAVLSAAALTALLLWGPA